MIRAQGKDESLTAFHEWIKNSPGFSQVKQAILRGTTAKKMSGFTVQKKPFLQDQLSAIKNLGGSF